MNRRGFGTGEEVDARVAKYRKIKLVKMGGMHEPISKGGEPGKCHLLSHILNPIRGEDLARSLKDSLSRQEVFRALFRELI